MSDTGIPDSTGNPDVEYHYGSVNQDSTSSRSGAERYRSGDNIFSGERGRTPTEEFGAEC